MPGRGALPATPTRALDGVVGSGGEWRDGLVFGVLGVYIRYSREEDALPHGAAVNYLAALFGQGAPTAMMLVESSARMGVGWPAFCRLAGFTLSGRP